MKTSKTRSFGEALSEAGAADEALVVSMSMKAHIHLTLQDQLEDRSEERVHNEAD